MSEEMVLNWKNRIISPQKVLAAIKPGMSIFVGTGMAEPRTLIRHLQTATGSNLQDLEIIQLMGLGDTMSSSDRYADKYRVKTFHSGCVADSAIIAGRVDFIPSRFSLIPALFKSGAIHIDAAFVQITPPSETGYASLGTSVDVAMDAMEQASLRVGEINNQAPRTLGHALVHVNKFDYFIQSMDALPYINRWAIHDIYRKIAANIASIVEDGSCISFSLGPLFEALGPRLSQKQNLGVHTPFFTDALMDLVKIGAVTNHLKHFYPGVSLTSYALGTSELMQWLDRNPLVEFHPIDMVMDFKNIGQNNNYIAILPARKVDLTGGIAGLGAVRELIAGAALSHGGQTIFALPSRNRRGESNICFSVADYPNHFSNRDSQSTVATEYGVAYIKGKTIRERALSLIDIAHPDDRAVLVRMAKEAKILYTDQIYFSEAGHRYPKNIVATHTFRGGLTVRFRPIKSSDEDVMRHLFYRASDRSVYDRYFNPVKTMPHGKMQEYVNVDYRTTMSIVGVIEAGDVEQIIAEARYEIYKDKPYADAAFIVDENYKGKGIATFMLHMLISIAQEQEGIEGFLSYVLADNKAILKVARKAPFPVQVMPAGECYEVKISFTKK
ncbi:MAG: GNAT family N-acetyltransferase [Syntrophales bacterium]|jgi:acyl-CoA hydrolase/RimJ/RimL family protein N-acetyltransferase|nr:GNAT family N-acetyltransferase [Syntrophales bacterium]MCK9391327.1 GNAT family N-acetyltransferase [Syntrophales bacterium]